MFFPLTFCTCIHTKVWISKEVISLRMHLLSVEHIQSSQLEWGNPEDTIHYSVLFIVKKHAVMYCIFPRSNFDDWKYGYVQLKRGALIMK